MQPESPWQPECVHDSECPGQCLPGRVARVPADSPESNELRVADSDSESPGATEPESESFRPSRCHRDWQPQAEPLSDIALNGAPSPTQAGTEPERHSGCHTVTKIKASLSDIVIRKVRQRVVRRSPTAFFTSLSLLWPHAAGRREVLRVVRPQPGWQGAPGFERRIQ